MWENARSLRYCYRPTVYHLPTKSSKSCATHASLRMLRPEFERYVPVGVLWIWRKMMLSPGRFVGSGDLGSKEAFDSRCDVVHRVC